MSVERNKFEWTMVLIVVTLGILLLTIIDTYAARDGDFVLVFFATLMLGALATSFKGIYRKLAEIERGDLRGKDDEDR